MGSPTIKIPMKDSLPFTTNELINLNIEKLNERKGKVFKEPNPYYVKGIYPTEYQEIKQWVDKLQKITKK